MRRIGAFMVIALALATGACSSGGESGLNDGGESGPGASGVEKSKQRSALTHEERGALCDWVSEELYGGYGKTMDCGSSSADSQQACIDSVPATCKATVAQSGGVLGEVRLPNATRRFELPPRSLRLTHRPGTTA